MSTEVRTLGVIGAGQMGLGIAQVAATQGIRVRISDADVERARAQVDGLVAHLTRLSERGKLEAEAVRAVQTNLEAASFEESMRGADFVIEAVSESLELKLDLFRRADSLAPEDAVLASNTSSISITRLAGATQRRERVIGMHFMNPVPKMPLVELIPGLQTSQATLKRASALAVRLEKTVIQSRDAPGFVVNRMLIPFLNEACFLLQERVGSAEDIDLGARLGLSHPMGPLELADLVGLDTVLAIAEVLQRELGDDKYRPSTLLRNLVAAGYLGKKSGRGFYAYDERGKKLPSQPQGGSA